MRPDLIMDHWQSQIMPGRPTRIYLTITTQEIQPYEIHSIGANIISSFVIARMANIPANIQQMMNRLDSKVDLNPYYRLQLKGPTVEVGKEFYKQIGQWLSNVLSAYKSIREPQSMAVVPIVTERLTKYIRTLPTSFKSDMVFRKILHQALMNCPSKSENVLYKGFITITSMEDLYRVAFGRTNDHLGVRDPLSLVERATILHILYGVEGLGELLVNLLHSIFDKHNKHMLEYDEIDEYELPDITLKELSNRSNTAMVEKVSAILEDENRMIQLPLHGTALALFKDAIKTVNPHFYKDIEAGKLVSYRNTHRVTLNRALNTMHEHPLFFTPNRLLNSTVEHNVNINSRWYNTRNGATLKKIFRNKRPNRTNKNSSGSLNNNNKRNNKRNKKNNVTRRQRRNAMLNRNL
jgi:hypothetical protein